MKRILLLCLMASLFSCAWAGKPGGKLVYCSYSATGVAGMGKNYCELVADPGTDPRIVVVLNHDCRFAPESRAEFPACAAYVKDLQEKLEKAQVYELDGYNVDESITGGTIYRIYMEYDSGEKINASWYGHDIKPAALAAYSLIEKWFAPWRSRLEEQAQDI